MSAEKVYYLYRHADEVWLQFEFDQQKSWANKAKHGIDFVQAQQLWLDEDLAEVPARDAGEKRFIVIGVAAGRCWSAVITYRGAAIRIISVRRSRSGEVGVHGR